MASPACDADLECSEWTAFSARGNYRINDGKVSIQIQTGTVADFDPTANKGTVLDAVTAGAGADAVICARRHA